MKREELSYQRRRQKEEKNLTDCPICGRDLQEKFCSYHQQAFDNLKETHAKWKTAAGLSWEEYLLKLSDLEDTGRWIVEVIEFITQQDGL